MSILTNPIDQFDNDNLQNHVNHNNENGDADSHKFRNIFVGEIEGANLFLLAVGGLEIAVNRFLLVFLISAETLHCGSIIGFLSVLC